MIPRRLPTSRFTSISDQPTTSSGATAPTWTVTPPKEIEPPGPSLRSSDEVRPRTASPLSSAVTIASRWARGRNGAYPVGSTAKESSGTSYGGVGWSTTAPFSSWEAVIHLVSPATTTVRVSPSALRIWSRNPFGNPPVIQASHAGTGCAEAAGEPAERVVVAWKVGRGGAAVSAPLGQRTRMSAKTETLIAAVRARRRRACARVTRVIGL